MTSVPFRKLPMPIFCSDFIFSLSLLESHVLNVKFFAHLGLSLFFTFVSSFLSFFNFGHRIFYSDNMKRLWQTEVRPMRLLAPSPHNLSIQRRMESHREGTQEHRHYLRVGKAWESGYSVFEKRDRLLFPSPLWQDSGFLVKHHKFYPFHLIIWKFRVGFMF